MTIGWWPRRPFVSGFAARLWSEVPGAKAGDIIRSIVREPNGAARAHLPLLQDDIA
jgi:hypothetical protein